VELLRRWAHQKRQRVPLKYLEKFSMELEVCELALRNHLPLEGILAVVDRRIAGFSLGAGHGLRCFNCMFEKTDLELKSAGVFVFSSLARHFSDTYSIINAGEDWEIPYIASAKVHWHPALPRPTYSVRLADGVAGHCDSQGS